MKSKKTIKAKRQENRIRKLEKAGRIVDGVEIPKDAVPANLEMQREAGPFSRRRFYKDIQYRCAGCQKEFVWTAE